MAASRDIAEQPKDVAAINALKNEAKAEFYFEQLIDNIEDAFNLIVKFNKDIKDLSSNSTQIKTLNSGTAIAFLVLSLFNLFAFYLESNSDHGWGQEQIRSLTLGVLWWVALGILIELNLIDAKDRHIFPAFHVLKYVTDVPLDKTLKDMAEVDAASLAVKKSVHTSFDRVSPHFITPVSAITRGIERANKKFNTKHFRLTPDIMEDAAKDAEDAITQAASTIYLSNLYQDPGFKKFTDRTEKLITTSFFRPIQPKSQLLEPIKEKDAKEKERVTLINAKP